MNGYSDSIIPGHDEHRCFLCGQNGRGKMDRHEIFGGAYRQKSKRLGLWVHLCHEPCHMTTVHRLHEGDLKEAAQRFAMKRYKWTTDDFIKEFGKNYLGGKDA